MKFFVKFKDDRNNHDDTFPANLILYKTNIGYDFITKVRNDLKQNIDLDKFYSCSEDFSVIHREEDVKVVVNDNVDIIDSLMKDGNIITVDVFFKDEACKYNLFNKYCSLNYKVEYEKYLLFFKRVKLIKPYIEVDYTRIVGDWIQDGCKIHYYI